MQKEYNINDIESILIKFTPESGIDPRGGGILYKGKGIEKVRRFMAVSTQYGEVGQGPVVVEDFSSDEEDQKPRKKTSSRGKKPSKTNSVASNGYVQQDLNYAPNKGKQSAVDLARDMQKQAAQAGFDFN